MVRAPTAAVAAIVTPGYWDDACRHLARRDRVMKKSIPRFGEAWLQSRGDAFTTLARSIVGQQISVKAAQAVWERFAALLPSPPTRLDSRRTSWPWMCPRPRGRPVARKCEYLRDLVHELWQRPRAVDQWRQMDDEAIIDELVAIRGIGRWTAEMFLIFHLMRPNVMPLDDVGLDQRHQPQLLQRVSSLPQ